MERKHSEKGQALILVALAAVGLFAFAALAIDGSRIYSDKRHAQNAADTAAMAAALAHGRGNNVDDAALARALANGYDDNGTTNDVTVTVTDSPDGACPANTEGKDITVDIVSTINATFARVIGRQTIQTAVTATSRTCGSYLGPPFDGNAIVALAPDGTGYDGTGNPNWNISGGGIYSNSTDANSAYCNGATDIIVPSITVGGNADMNCDHGLPDDNIGPITPNAPTYSTSNIASFFPRQPSCNGTASQSGGQVSPQSGADGSRIAFPTHGDINFTPGLYCITNSGNTNIHGNITGSDVTFYFMAADLRLNFNGGGTLTASAQNCTADPGNCWGSEYDGILIYLAPQFDANGNLTQTQQFELHGNGTGDLTGTIWAPSAIVTMLGNSGTGAFNSQIIAYRVNSGGNADITVRYNPDDNQTIALPITLAMLR